MEIRISEMYEIEYNIKINISAWLASTSAQFHYRQNSGEIIELHEASLVFFHHFTVLFERTFFAK